MSELVPIKRWAKVLDQTKCIGCHACSTACKSENAVPVGVNRTYVKAVEVGTFPTLRRAFQVTRCNQCEGAPCTVACPTRAMYRRRDGIVDFDKSICIGCKACIAACPYDAIFINPEDHSAEKCNMCSHRIDVGLEPACVTVCPTNAIIVGDLDDPSSAVSRIVNRDVVAVRRPEKETHPKVFYKGAHQATLDPLAARRPDGGLYMWSEQPRVPHGVTAGHPEYANTSSAALLAYDVAHRAPWDWRVSLYTWTKSISAGVYLVGLLLLALGAIEPGGTLWRWAVPVTAGAFLGLTGIVLIADLDHPERFYLIFTRHHGKSWLVRGAFIIAGYGAVLAAHFVASLLGEHRASAWLGIAGGPLAAMTAIYTAFLFAQAKARDLWQSPLLPPHLIVQAVMVGSAALLLVESAVAVPHALVSWVLAIASAVHVLMVLGEITLTHGTAHARLASLEMTRGAYARVFWAGLVLAAIAVAAPWLPVVAPIAALLGVLAFEHAHVQAGQSVPLA
ncbi:MAG TPA: 4Fe-4S dicluster domain-containing protein [Kofleriaceae bacterium]|nr:4Fe-4S dicluster domain-containing protein [Kofleriaceae bacterium]